MLDSAFRDVNEWLINNGFERDATETRLFSYNGYLLCHKEDIPVKLCFADLDFQDLPDIYLKEPRPECLKKFMPHIETDKKICYLNIETYRLDPYRPVQTIVNCLDQATNVLNENISGENTSDIDIELSAYWHSDRKGVALSRHQSGDIVEFNVIRYISPLGKNRDLITIGDAKKIFKYKNKKEGTFVLENYKSAIWIKVNKSVFLSVDTEWPPKHFASFYNWLKLIDLAAATTLHKILGTKNGAQSEILIILETNSGLIGVRIEVPLELFQNSPGRFRKQLLIDKGLSKIKFTRVVIDDLSPDYLFSRNLQGETLSSKKIALIGCGTIGGYLSRLLVQAGAGSKSDELDLYDQQLLSVGNLGRHYLDENYLYENKAEACQHKLSTEFNSINIESYPKEFNVVDDLDNYDLVIDATGREPFSLSLNHQSVKLHNESHRSPDVLYVWVDGNGYCGRTLLYNGIGGCYRCLQDLRGQDKFPALKSENDRVPMKYTCGESFVPYPASVSVQAAGLGLEVILEWVNGKVKNTFRNRHFHEKAREHNDKKLKPVKECPACQN